MKEADYWVRSLSRIEQKIEPVRPFVDGLYIGEVHVIDGENHTSIMESAAAMTIIKQWLGDTQLAAQD